MKVAIFTTALKLVKVLLAKEWVIRRPVLITPHLHQRLLSSATAVPIGEKRGPDTKMSAK